MAAKFKQLFAEIFGFACFQGFLFALFGMGTEEISFFNALMVNRGMLLTTLLFAAAALAVLRVLPHGVLQMLMRPACMYGYALVLIGASLVLLLVDELPRSEIPYSLMTLCGAFRGVAIAPLLCAWGRLLGSYSLDDASFAVIAGSMAGALAGAACCLAPELTGALIIDLLPLGAASTLRLRLPQRQQAALSSCDGSSHEAAASAKAIDLSVRIMSGAFVFGIGSGFAYSFMGNEGQTFITFPLSLLIFVMLTIAALQIFFRPVSLRGESSATVSITTAQFCARQGAVAYVYRLAILMMVSGFLFVPALQDLTINGQSIVFAGYLGLLMMLVIVFLVNAVTTARDPAMAFSAGFAVLLGGQAAGLVFGGVCDAFMDSESFQFWAFAVAGLLVLVAFLFLFTENDLGELGSVEKAIDRFDEACARLVERNGLSKREAEILPLALKGRTSERIAEQFVISKSTVDTHLRRIYSKCGVHNRQDLIDLEERVAEEIASTKMG